MKIQALHELLGRERNEEWKALRATLAGTDEALLCAAERLVMGGINGCTPRDNLQVLASRRGEALGGTPGEPAEPYNTYPFGVKTSEVYPRLFAVCAGRMRLEAALNYLKRRSSEMAALRTVERKTVFLLTDKWDAGKFRDYEADLLNYAARDNIWYVFLLVTDYGITKIPFLPDDRDAFRRAGIRNAEKNASVPAMLSRLHDVPMTYQTDAGTLNRGEITDYLFDTAHMICTKRSLSDGSGRSRIPEKALARFLKSAAWVFDDAILLQPTRTLYVCDAGCRQLQIFEKEIDFGLSYTDRSGACSDERLAMLLDDLRRELDILINSCERHPID